MNCYYLVASLPTLALGDPPPWPSGETAARCANMLDEAQVAELRLFLEGREGEASSGFARQWRNADTQLRNAVARVRAARHSLEARPHLREHEGFDVSLEKGVADAYAKPNPLERALELDRLRWKLLDSLVLNEPFGFSAVLAWALKLRMVERWAALTEKEGRKQFEALVADAMKGEAAEAREPAA